MAASSLSTPNYANSGTGNTNARGLCRIVGVACLIGFLVDMAVLTFPPAFGELTWRIGFMQQMGDRSIILLFGLALMLYSALDTRTLRRQLAIACLAIGIIFPLSCVLVVRDAITFQNMAVNNISVQLERAQKQLAEIKPGENPQLKVTQEQLQTVAKQLSGNAQVAQQTAKNTSIKTGLSSVGNLLVVGLALLGLGRYGMRPPRG
ncbi:HpsJ family protein [Alkalinema pantanalense CENA528]|uniref:HpsJ-like protein, cyanoexosortase C-associated n=1 Tax=Alkalinema pantanalense TaxID=1620705 RepID=UPI003D6ED3DE